jgi:hypothetical protein
MAEAGACATKIVGSKMVEADSFGISPHGIPDYVRCHATFLCLSRFRDSSEDSSFRSHLNAGAMHPEVAWTMMAPALLAVSQSSCARDLRAYQGGTGLAWCLRIEYDIALKFLPRKEPRLRIYPMILIFADWAIANTLTKPLPKSIAVGPAVTVRASGVQRSPKSMYARPVPPSRGRQQRA